MAIEAQRVTVGDTQTALHTGSDTDSHAGYSLLITNRSGTDSVDIGPTGVASGAGVEVKPGESLSLDLFGDVVYAIAPSLTSVRVDVLRIGVYAMPRAQLASATSTGLLAALTAATLGRAGTTVRRSRALRTKL